MIDDFFLPGQKYDCHLKKTDGWIYSSERFDLISSLVFGYL